jgi:uncharacterized protein
LTPATDRHALIDALRGFALLGILLVNIQSFTWGVGMPTMGMLYEESSWLDEATVFLTVLLLEFKIYPLFCFCFGYGFALMAKSWRASGLNAKQVSRRFNRRLNFLLLIGLAHGVVIWFGDVLARYALAGYLMRRHAQLGPRRLLKPIRFWLITSIVITLITAALAGLGALIGQDDAGLVEMLARAQAYASGSYLETIGPRIDDYSAVLFSWLFVFPQAVLLFLLGAFVARVGWLKHPARHAAKWRRVLIYAMALGAVPSYFAAQHALAWSYDPSLISGALDSLATTMMSLASPAFVAAFALAAPTRWGAAVVALFAPVGRLALSNYLAQSLFMSVLLAGYGLGWSDRGQFTIAAMALGVFALQLVASHVHLRTHTQGPLEALWRRFTYK